MRSASLTATLLLLCCAASAGQPAEEAAENWLPARPDISDYTDEGDFVSDVLSWERKREEIAGKIRTGELPEAPPAPHEEHDWHHVTGPEDLELALENAAGYIQPNYREKYRFNRTTHLSFPLPQLPSEQMAEKRVPPPEEEALPMETPLVMIDDAGHLVLQPAPEPGAQLAPR